MYIHLISSVLGVQIGHWSVLAAGLDTRQDALAALAVHMLWGQLSSLFVEYVAATSGMWAYTPSRRNPSIIQLPNGSHLTALPQAIWAYASLAFFVVCYSYA
jgi:hypothetical protein